MAKRPNQHKTEDKSYRRFGDLIPEDWLLRQKPKDYGIDLEIEIFDNDESTGLVFWCQVKGTQSTNSYTQSSFSFDMEKLRDFREYELPVLLARYSDTTNSFFFRWSDSIDLYYAKGQKTITVKFDEWDREKTPTCIVDYIQERQRWRTGEIRFPLTTSISIETDRVGQNSKRVFLLEYESYVKEYSEFLRYEEKNTSSDIPVKITENEIRIPMGVVTGGVLHGFSSNPALSSREIFKEVLIGVARNLFAVRKYELGAQLLFHDELKPHFFQNPEYFISLLRTLLSTSKCSSVLEELAEISQKISLQKLITINHVVLEELPQFSVNEKRKSAYKAYLRANITRLKDDGENETAGIFLYNLSNFLGRNDEFKAAIVNFIEVPNLNSDYLNRGYYHRELGGCYWFCEEYSEAARSYKKAWKIEKKPELIPLIIDSLFFSGAYQDSLNCYKKNKNLVNSFQEVLFLKSECIAFLIDETGIQKQKRTPVKRDSISDRDAIGTDALAAYLWFNRGLEEEDSKRKVLLFALCGFIDETDLEAWTNATVFCFSPSSQMMLNAVVQSGYLFNRERYLTHLYKHIEETLPSIAVEQMTGIIESIIYPFKTSLREREETVTRRFFL